MVGYSLNPDSEEYKDKIENMLNDDRNRWNWAENTLNSILHFIEMDNNITEAQIRAVDNIYNSVEKNS